MDELTILLTIFLALSWPIFCVDISCFNFSGLLLGTTPWEPYVCKLVIWVKHCNDIELIYIYSNENPYQDLEQSQASHQALNNTFQSLWGHLWEHLHIGNMLGNPASSPKQSGVLQEWEAHARGLVASWKRCIPGSNLNPIKVVISLDSHIETNVHTVSISRASMTWTQSRSVILNAVQGMCFTRQLLWCNVVIGPYIWLADVMNNAIGCKHVSILVK